MAINHQTYYDRYLCPHLWFNLLCLQHNCTIADGSVSLNNVLLLKWILTRRAMFGNTNTSSSFPEFSSGTHVNGNTGVIVSVSLLLNVTFLCAEFSLKYFNVTIKICSKWVGTLKHVCMYYKLNRFN